MDATELLQFLVVLFVLLLSSPPAICYLCETSLHDAVEHSSKRIGIPGRLVRGQEAVKADASSDEVVASSSASSSEREEVEEKPGIGRTDQELVDEEREYVGTLPATGGHRRDLPPHLHPDTESSTFGSGRKRDKACKAAKWGKSQSGPKSWDRDVETSSYDAARQQFDEGQASEAPALEPSIYTSHSLDLAPGPTCEVCSKEFENAYFLRQHKSKKHPWSLLCTKCCISFRHAADAQEHYRLEHAEDGFDPVREDERIEREQILAQTQRYHNPYDEAAQYVQCEKCLSVFDTEESLALHIRDPFSHGYDPKQEAHAEQFPALSGSGTEAKPSIWVQRAPRFERDPAPVPTSQEQVAVPASIDIACRIPLPNSETEDEQDYHDGIRTDDGLRTGNGAEAPTYTQSYDTYSSSSESHSDDFDGDDRSTVAPSESVSQVVRPASTTDEDKSPFDDDGDDMGDIMPGLTSSDMFAAPVLPAEYHNRNLPRYATGETHDAFHQLNTSDVERLRLEEQAQRVEGETREREKRQQEWEERKARARLEKMGTIEEMLPSFAIPAGGGGGVGVFSPFDDKMEEEADDQIQARSAREKPKPVEGFEEIVPPPRRVKVKVNEESEPRPSPPTAARWADQTRSPHLSAYYDDVPRPQPLAPQYTLADLARRSRPTPELAGKKKQKQKGGAATRTAWAERLEPKFDDEWSSEVQAHVGPRSRGGRPLEDQWGVEAWQQAERRNQNVIAAGAEDIYGGW